MATIKVIEIISRVENVLQDSGIRWPRTELQQWLNEAYLTIILARPDANAQTGTFSCVAGTRQRLNTVFPSALRVLDVIRNVAATSTKRVVRQIDRVILDDQKPTWHADTPVVNIQHFMFDPRLPKEFLVYPPATALAELEVAYTAPVASHALTETQLDPANLDTTVINIDDLYAGAIVDWILYRAYSKDAEYGENQNRAMSALNAFNAQIGAKSATDSAADPQVKGRVT